MKVAFLQPLGSMFGVRLRKKGKWKFWGHESSLLSKQLLVLRGPRDDSMVNGYGLDHSHPFSTTFAPGRWFVGVFFALARVFLWKCGREKGERLRDLGFEDQNDTSQICQIRL